VTHTLYVDYIVAHILYVDACKNSVTHLKCLCSIVKPLGVFQKRYSYKIFHLSISLMQTGTCKRVHARHHQIFKCHNRSMVGFFTLRCHWNVTNCRGIWINNTRIILQCIWGGFILIQYNCDKLWNSGIIRTATKQKSKQREFRFVYFSLSLKCYKL